MINLFKKLFTREKKIEVPINGVTTEQDYYRHIAKEMGNSMNFDFSMPDPLKEVKNNHIGMINAQVKNAKDVCSNASVEQHRTQTMDSASTNGYGSYQFPYSLDNNLMNDAMLSNNLFQGFAFLSEFAQVPLVNNAINAYSKDMLRGGFKLGLEGGVEKTDMSPEDEEDTEHAELIKQLNLEWVKYDCDIHLIEMIEKTLYLGGAMLYAKLKGDDDRLEKELKVLNTDTIAIGDLQWFKVIEPTWCWNLGFNADRPLEPDFYKPTLYNVMGKTIHISRMYKTVFWQVPDLIKPIYYFYGLSLTQKMLQSLRNFETVQTEIPSLVKRLNFGILKLPLSEFANSMGKVVTRIKQFIYSTTNYSLFVINKDNEEFEMVNRNISGLDDIVTKYAELASVANQIPVTKFLGTNPKGFSTNDENSLINWEDLITGLRVTKGTPLILHMYKLLALNIGVELPKDLTICWGNLRDSTPLDSAKAELLQAQTEQVNENKMSQNGKSDIIK